MKALTRSVVVMATFFSPLVASAAWSVNFSFGSGGCTGGICGIAQTILYIINDVLVPVLFALAFIVFLYGIAKAYIFSRGDDGEISKGHQLLLWGIIGFVVMISIWGLVNVVASTFGLTGGYAPEPPRSYP
jgi:hypothetical protein